jgi:hypothetical protein
MMESEVGRDVIRAPLARPLDLESLWVSSGPDEVGEK